METAEKADAATQELPPYRRKLREMFSNRRWIADNIDELMTNYRDRWIVVVESSVVGKGATAEAAVANCNGHVDEVEAIVLLVPAEIHRPI